VRTLDVAKRLIDYGIHPPTIYFPLTVPEALMIEPTETESKQTLDRFMKPVPHVNPSCAGHPPLNDNQTAGQVAQAWPVFFTNTSESK